VANVPNTVSTLNGMFKVVYADKLLDLIPNFALLQKLIDFSPADKETGNYYAQPVVLAHEAGFTYLGTSGATSTLSDAQAGVMKEAQVYGSELNLRAQLSFMALTRASQKGAKAFERVSRWKVEDMNNAIRKRLEIAMLYGQSGIGTVDVVTDVTPGSVATISITAGTWAGGIWAGAEGAKLDAFTSTTKNNGTAALQVTSVDSDTRTLTISYSGTLASEVAAGDVLYFTGSNAGSSSFNEMAGLQKILTNTGSLFNINATTYSLWKGNTVSSVGQISFAKLQDAVAKAVNKGLMEDVAVFLSPKAWAVLNSDAAALRVFDSSYKTSKSENGAESLEFYSQNGKMKVFAHPLVKDGDGFIVPLEKVLRIGSVDLTFGRPGVDSDETAYFDRVPNTNALEIQAVADQAIFLETPAEGVYLSGITYA
jgi:hypothetical protein